MDGTFNIINEKINIIINSNIIVFGNQLRIKNNNNGKVPKEYNETKLK